MNGLKERTQEIIFNKDGIIVTETVNDLVNKTNGIRLTRYNSLTELYTKFQGPIVLKSIKIEMSADVLMSLTLVVYNEDDYLDENPKMVLYFERAHKNYEFGLDCKEYEAKDWYEILEKPSNFFIKEVKLIQNPILIELENSRVIEFILRY